MKTFLKNNRLKLLCSGSFFGLAWFIDASFFKTDFPYEPFIVATVPFLSTFIEQIKIKTQKIKLEELILSKYKFHRKVVNNISGEEVVILIDGLGIHSKQRLNAFDKEHKIKTCYLINNTYNISKKSYKEALIDIKEQILLIQKNEECHVKVVGFSIGADILLDLLKDKTHSFDKQLFTFYLLDINLSLKTASYTQHLANYGLKDLITDTSYAGNNWLFITKYLSDHNVMTDSQYRLELKKKSEIVVGFSENIKYFCKSYLAYSSNRLDEKFDLSSKKTITLINIINDLKKNKNAYFYFSSEEEEHKLLNENVKNINIIDGNHFDIFDYNILHQ